MPRMLLCASEAGPCSISLKSTSQTSLSSTLSASNGGASTPAACRIKRVSGFISPSRKACAGRPCALSQSAAISALQTVSLSGFRCPKTDIILTSLCWFTKGYPPFNRDRVYISPAPLCRRVFSVTQWQLVFLHSFDFHQHVIQRGDTLKFSAQDIDQPVRENRLHVPMAADQCEGFFVVPGCQLRCLIFDQRPLVAVALNREIGLYARCHFQKRRRIAQQLLAEQVHRRFGGAVVAQPVTPPVLTEFEKVGRGVDPVFA